jgi:lipopolysaccharide transport system ATP-binding protein
MSSLTVEHLGKCYHIGGKGGKTPYAGPARSRPGKQQRELWALKDVSFAVEPGAVLGIIGPNGAGKSTLLKILARVTPPTEGRVVGRGRVVSLLEAGTGFNPELTGRENIFMNAAMYGIPRSHIMGPFDKIVDFAGLADFIDMPLKHYSSGMYLRLAFSVAVNMEPDILLADEVLAVGDTDFQEKCLRRVGEAGKQGMTVLFVSHDMAAITRLCGRVVWLNAGKIVDSGEPQAVVSRYQNAAWTLSNSQNRGAGSDTSEFGEILSIRLCSSSGQEIGSVRTSEDVYIKVFFRTLKPGLMARCALDVYAKGVHAFRSVQPGESAMRSAGAYSASVLIPAHLLSETIYTVNASVTLSEGGREHPLVVYNALAFQVYDTDELVSSRGTYKGALPGVVSPRLQWALSSEREGAKV